MHRAVPHRTGLQERRSLTEQDDGPALPEQRAGARRVLLQMQNRMSSVEHYYHFTLGFLVPLVLRHIEAEAETCFLVRSCGPMDTHVRALGLANLEIVTKAEWFALRATRSCGLEPISGYDSPEFYDGAAFAHVRDAMWRTFDAAGPPDAAILMIARGASPDYYQSEAAEARTSANLRRTVPNLADVARALAAANLDCRVEELETWPLGAQIRLFARTRTLVAQHGAALVNMIWMAPGATVVEINPKSADDEFVDFFRRLAEVCGHDYVCLKQAHKDAVVDPADVLGVFVSLGRVSQVSATQAVATAQAAADTRADGRSWPPAARPVARYDVGGWEKWLAKMQWAMVQQKVDLVWVGDSIAHRFERNGPEDWNRYRPVWEQYYAPRNALNLGFSGDDTRHVIWRLMYGGMERIRPKLTIVTVGINNFSENRFRVDDTVSGIERVVELVRERMPTSHVLLLGVLQGFRGPAVAGRILKLNRLLAERWAAVDRVTFVNANACLRTDGKLDAAMFAETYDGRGVALHPTPAAMARIAAMLEPHVERVFSQG